MKTKIITTFLFLIVAIATTPILAYDPPPPPPVGGNGDQEPPGGGAPVGEGVLIIISLSAVYGRIKFKKTSNRTEGD